ncbi:hypothetical protein [Neptunomonas marina]|uniref:Uncharacterized protein n=1 Tax=Neptunomonas marina TaxID=1815562 RepID=A0A437QDW6_9GAMM|nr:hypothetical protein [Neptunomonas marina]RVU32714.1 hypothetical protein EOE65_03400 [Neptunomonas marina]
MHQEESQPTETQMPAETREASPEDNFDAAFDEFSGESPVDSETYDERTHQADQALEQPRDSQGRFANKEAAAEAEAEGGDQEETDTGAADSASGVESTAGTDWDSKDNPWKHRYQSEMGRVPTLQRQINELQRQLQANQVAAPAQQEQAVLSEQDMSALAETFPEAARAIQAQAAQLQQLSTSYQQLQNQVVPIQEQAQHQQHQMQAQLLDQQFPGWQQTVSTAEFTDWISSQPAHVQELMNSNDASEAAYLLNGFNQHQDYQKLQQTQQEQHRKANRDRKLSQSQTLPAKGHAQRSAAEDDFDSAFDEFAD